MGDNPLVGIVMGSDSDWPTMEAAALALREFDVPYEADVVSAHRMPEDMVRYGREAHGRGLRCLIAGAGGAAHLPGMLAALTPLPVIGVPVPLRCRPASPSRRWPSGRRAPRTPGTSRRILSLSSPGLREKVRDHRRKLAEALEEAAKKLS